MKTLKTRRAARLANWASDAPNLIERTTNEALAAQNAQIESNVLSLTIANDNGKTLTYLYKWMEPSTMTLSDAIEYILFHAHVVHVSPNGNCFIIDPEGLEYHREGDTLDSMMTVKDVENYKVK